MANAHSETADAGAGFSSERLAGLSEAEAASRIARDGFNELPSSQPRSVFRIAFEVVREPMLLLLLACGSTYLLLGNVQEAVILLVFVVVVTTITLYQERKTERALEALRDLSSPRALVVRGGVRRRIAGREVVPGDILVLSEGDRVPADGVLMAAVNLATDESLLTGESVPVRKQAASADLPMARPGGDDLPFVFSGNAGRSRRRAGGGESDRRSQRARQDRQVASRGRTGTDAAAAGHTAHGPRAGGWPAWRCADRWCWSTA